MKILFWMDRFWPCIGGIETQTFQLIRGLQEKGHKCIVIAVKDHADRKEDEVYQGIAIKRFDFEAIVAKRELQNLRLVENYLQGIVREVDIVHLNACIGWGVFAFSLFRNLFRMPVILTIHAPLFYESKILSMVAKTSSLADQIGCVSKWVFDEMEKHIPAVKDKLRMIYNGLPMPDIDPSALSFSPPVLLLLGRLAPEKGFEIAIKAFSLLKNRAQLLIVGEGPERVSLERLVGQLELEDSVKFLGGVERGEVPALINQATLVVIPSRYEPFGLVAIEAMQMGRPVIASNVGGLREIVLNHETGLLVSPEDPVAFCQAIEDLLKDPKRVEKMGMQARKYAMENFTLHQNVFQYETLYEMVR